ncbi:MAG TPA: acyl-ACP--UDP-N-acetylglucosamine O-acyltransferase [Nitrospinota bacterium]|nr:acyl-ACP--UDP-N-acetylglucosamine O-acyltransferase [Nitrospinota bacterium]
MIDKLASVHKRAEIDSDVSIGPYSVIGENVRIGRGTKIDSNVVIKGWTEIGENCQISSGAVLGEAPQHMGYKGEKSYVRIGNYNIIREFVTIHRSCKERETTCIGHNNFFMAYSHVGHDCLIGSHVIITSFVGISGHVTVEDRVVIGGHTAIHQFVRIGTLAMVSGTSRVVKDIPPYFIAEGNPSRIRAVNVVGLRRAGISQETRNNIKKAYKVLYHSNLNTSQALEKIKEEIKMEKEIAHLIEFIEKSERGICA